MKTKLSEDDIRLFREATRDVAPLAPKGQATPPRQRPPRPRVARVRRLAALEESLSAALEQPMVASGDALSFRQPGVTERVLRKLRRGEYGVQGELDLHGLTVAQSRQAIRDFLTEAFERRARCVRIIHGKGLGSGDRGPVLKSAVSELLRRTSVVVAYVSAAPVDGGTGALFVLLAPAKSR